MQDSSYPRTAEATRPLSSEDEWKLAWANRQFDKMRQASEYRNEQEWELMLLTKHPGPRCRCDECTGWIG